MRLDNADRFWTNPDLRSLNESLLGPHAHGMLRSLLASMLSEPQFLAACKLKWAEFKPRQKLTAYFEAEVNCPNQSRIKAWPLAAVWQPTHILNSSRESSVSLAEALQSEARSRRVLGPWSKLYAVQSAVGLELRVWPLDEKFPQLLRLANANHAGVLFQAANLLHGNTAGSPPTTRYHVFPIRFRPGERHVLRFEVSNDGETADELRTVFAKLYSCAEEALRSYRVACQVADRLPPCGDGVTAVRPLACLQEDAVVLFPRLDGTTLSSHIKLAGTNCQRWIHCAGEGLRVLHDGVPIEPVPTLINDLKRDRGFAKDVKKMVRRTCQHIQALLPEVGTHISELLLRAKELYERLPQEPPTLTHGDLKADHLWITRTGLKLIDFDTCTVADPALDVGKFLADLRWWHTILDLDELELTQAHFLDAYGAGAPPARLQRARVYESLVLIRLGVHRLPLFAEDWADRTRQLVTKAEGVLQELSNSIR